MKVISKENGVNCPKCQHAFDVPADKHGDPKHVKRCPSCGHSWSFPWSFSKPEQTGGDENRKWIDKAVNAATGEGASSKAEMLALLRDEARISAELRDRARDRAVSPPAGDETQHESQAANQDPVSVHRSSSRRFSVYWFVAAAALFLAYRFNDQLAELLPAAAPVFEEYREFADRFIYDIGRLIDWVLELGGI